MTTEEYNKLDIEAKIEYHAIEERRHSEALEHLHLAKRAITETEKEARVAEAKKSADATYEERKPKPVEEIGIEALIETVNKNVEASKE